MKFLIAGLGSIGRRHLRNLIALGEEDIVLYRTGKSTLPSEELSGHVIEDDLDSALAHNPDAVIISNPTALHLDVAIPAARSGCALLLEKPIAATMQRVDELVGAVEDSGSPVLVGFQYRFHPGLLALKKALVNGRLGRPLYARAHWGEYLPDWHPWEDYRQSYAARPELGGGVALTLCHPFDYLRLLFGDVLSIDGWVGNLSDLDLDVEDCAEAWLAFANGVKAAVHLNYFERPKRHTLEIIGSEARLSWSDDTGGVIINEKDGTSTAVYAPPAGFERNTLFISEMSHFLELVSGVSAPICSLDDGIEALRLVMALKAS